MDATCENNNVGKELFLEKIQKLSLTVEKLSSEISQLKNMMEKNSKINRPFGLKAIKNSKALDFAGDVYGLSSPSKKYLISFRFIQEEWKGKDKNSLLITVRQQIKENGEDLNAIGIRIPLDDVKTLRVLARQIISLLFVSCELKQIEINDILREILQDISKDGNKIMSEIRAKLS